MWRFILVTFGFLGWAFYELSGGADYVPHANSIQARAKQDALRPADVEVAELAGVPDTVEPADTTQEPTVSRSAASLADLETKDGERFEITLASVRAEEPVVPDQTRTKAEVLTATDDNAVDEAVVAALSEGEEQVREMWPGAIEMFAMQEERATLRAEAEAAARAAMDIRYVTGNVVNMRGGPGTEFDKVGKLTEGTEVAVIADSGDGWLMLRVMDTGEEGWMADWLVSASN